ncbi:alpha/beta fold hydrolase [Asanoa ferruginea]|uniref:alpha/beta fold hydrolase n=1 Tax=Asanoa ferruginea TaxID=53367 RepID=UPI000E25DF4F|nr:alpha/beta fold hydrolase [Asanoa ferruginea]
MSGTLAYTFAGRGEPLLLVHGLGGSRHTWRHLISTLAQTHTVIAPDLPGHGDSGAPDGDYSLGAHATALRDLPPQLTPALRAATLPAAETDKTIPPHHHEANAAATPAFYTAEIADAGHYPEASWRAVIAIGQDH